MKPDCTENLQHELQESKWIVENMIDSEIFSKVNNDTVFSSVSELI